MMNPSDRQAAIYRLLYEFASTKEEYISSIQNDEVFKVKKKLRLRLKELEKQILVLKEERQTFFVPEIIDSKTQRN